jgi:hypothetical protein
MNLRDPRRLRRTVDFFAHEHAIERGLRLLRVAVDALVRPGLKWDPGELTEVDLNRLSEAIRAVVWEIPRPSDYGGTLRQVNGPMMSQAMAKAPYHYLWFC